MTRTLADWTAQRGGRLHSVEPQPAPDVVELDASSDSFTLVEGLSPDALEGIPAGDAYIVDGDHNHWVVSRELAAIYADGAAPLSVLHDVGWPCARRDQYYAPHVLPPEGVHPHSWDRGKVLDREELVEGGFRGPLDFASALREGGDGNGVLTAVEEFVATRDDLVYRHIPAIFGVGVIFPQRGRVRRGARRRAGAVPRQSPAREARAQPHPPVPRACSTRRAARARSTPPATGWSPSTTRGCPSSRPRTRGCARRRCAARTRPRRPAPTAPADAVEARERYAAIDVRDLRKVVRVPHNQAHTLKERVLHPFRRGSFDERDALDDVSFEVGRGRVLRHRRPQRLRQEHAAEVPRRHLPRRTPARCGCAGGWRRSSSSASASTPTSPRATTSLINAVMLGLTPREARARFDAIIDFAELEEFVDLKLKNYSSGMQVRLAFAVMVARRRRRAADRRGARGRRRRLPAEVLRRVRARCATRAARSCSSPTTWTQVERFCDRAMLLERGPRGQIGRARARSARRYIELNFEPADAEARTSTAADGRREHRRRLGRRRRRRSAGSSARRTASRCAADVTIECARAGRRRRSSTSWSTTRPARACSPPAPRRSTAASARSRPGSACGCALRVDNRLAPGRYRLGCVAAGRQPRAGQRARDLSEHAADVHGRLRRSRLRQRRAGATPVGASAEP